MTPNFADRDGLIWFDGKMVPWRDAKVHVLTHTLHYGMGVFEGVRAYDADGGTAIACTADIRDTDAVANLTSTTLEAFGGIDILVNNAAMRSNVPFTEIDDESWDRIIGTTVQGAFNTCRAAVPHIIERGGGAIISVGGMSAHRGAARRSRV